MPGLLAAKDMDKFHSFMMCYTLGLGGLINSYCKWAESQAKNDSDLLVLGIGPLFVFALILWSLPSWLGKAISFVLLLPALYLVFIVLRAYAARTGNRK